jgi:hypothetical protein
VGPLYAANSDIAATLIAVEVDSKLFLLRRRYLYDDVQPRFYFPARKNAELYTHILSTFHRFKCRAAAEFATCEADDEILLLCEIDIGSRDCITRLWQSGSCPGIFLFWAPDEPPAPEGDEDPFDSRYLYTREDGCSKRYKTMYYYFTNGTLPVGLDSFRTICQLWAAFTCASVVTIRGPGSASRDFRFSLPDFRHDSAFTLQANMIATYATLLAVGPKHFNYAIRILDTTKKNIEHFIQFLKRVNFEDPKGDSTLKWVKVMEGEAVPI